MEVLYQLSYPGAGMQGSRWTRPRQAARQVPSAAPIPATASSDRERVRLTAATGPPPSPVALDRDTGTPLADGARLDLRRAAVVERVDAIGVGDGGRVV
jgi:hypothetical protein